jgi:hypothetical protein
MIQVEQTGKSESGETWHHTSAIPLVPRGLIEEIAYALDLLTVR